MLVRLRRSPTMRDTATNGSPRKPNSTDRRLGTKYLCEATGSTMNGMRQWLRRHYGRHDCWQLWLFSQEEAEEIIKKKRVTNGRASST
jgi:hypothetical protein